MIFLLAAIAFHLTAPADEFNVRDFGAKADALTDDTPAFQKALDECGKTGGTVKAPAGRYLLMGSINIPDGVTLEGSFKAPARAFHYENAMAGEPGTILLTTEGKGLADGNPFITLNRASTLKGLIVFYPQQTLEPVAYPWCVRGRGDNCTILDTELVNPYRAVDFGSLPCGRHLINGLYGQALKTGIFIDNCLDVGRLENVHFWPFWSADKKLWDWTSKNGVAFLIGKTDWEYMSNCFDILYSIGYHFYSGTGGPGNAVLSNCGSDTGPLAVKIDAVQMHAGVSFENGQFMSSVEIGPDNQGPVKFTNCGFWGLNSFTDEHARIRGFGQTTFTACHFINGAQINKHAYAIDAFSGGLTVNGCEFMDTEPISNQIRIGAAVRTAVILGNTFRAPIHITNASQGQVAIIANVTASPGR